MRVQKVDEFSICCFAGLAKLDADGLKLELLFGGKRLEGALALLCWQLQERCQLDGKGGQQGSALRAAPVSLLRFVPSRADTLPCTSSS